MHFNLFRVVGTTFFAVDFFLFNFFVFVASILSLLHHFLSRSLIAPSFFIIFFVEVDPYFIFSSCSPSPSSTSTSSSPKPYFPFHQIHLRRRYFLHFLRCRRFFTSNFLCLLFFFNNRFAFVDDLSFHSSSSSSAFSTFGPLFSPFLRFNF